MEGRRGNVDYIIHEHHQPCASYKTSFQSEEYKDTTELMVY